MKRHALIIECSAINGQDKLPGAIRDAEAWQKYLRSNIGGAWSDSEISILRNPTPSEMKALISRRSDDYNFITFSGHGYVASHTNETMICLQGGSLSETDLITPASRSTVILDSCRGILSAHFSEALCSEMYKSFVDSQRYRTLFDNAISRAEKGVCQLYGCSFGEAAQESKAGGEFTQALIQAGESWNERGVLSLHRAFEHAEKILQRTSPGQTPESKLGRRLNHFPFAVQP